MLVIAACESCGTQYDVSGCHAGELLQCRCGVPLAVPQPSVRDARVVRCASCGGLRGDGGENCAFCGARFTAFDQGWSSMCPGCFCRLPVDAGYCVECGLKIAPQALRHLQSELFCPRCRVNLCSRRFENFEIQECGLCAGVWLPHAIFESICKEREARGRVTQLLWDVIPQERPQVAADERVTYIPCPTCKNMMNRRNFANVSGVVIDTCGKHGIWLDHQELNRIVQFIEAGGMERSRESAERDRKHIERMKTFGVPKRDVDDSSFVFTGKRSEVNGLRIADFVTFVANLFIK